jgi:hypothetical protein
MAVREAPVGREAQLWVRVGDARTEETLAFDVAPADALDSFHHPLRLRGLKGDFR